MKSAQQSKAPALPDSDMDVLAAMLGPLEALEALLDRPVSGACP
jgi:hypothetical protein